MFRWIASLLVVVFPACVLLVGDWAVALLLLPALGGLVAATRKDTRPLGQSEKLLYLAMAIFFIQTFGPPGHAGGGVTLTHAPLFDLYEESRIECTGVHA